MFARIRKSLDILVFSALLVAPLYAQKTASIDDLDAIVGSARYVNVGEDSHFMVGVHEFVARSFKHLAEKKGFRVFVFESAWGIEDTLADFMNSDRTTVNGEEGFFLNAFNSKSTVEMLIWIREWNRKNPGDKIRIAGYQPEQPVTDFNKLWEFAGKSDKFVSAGLKEKAVVCRTGTGEYKTNIEFIISTSKLRRSGKPSYTTEDRAGCNQAIDAIETFIAQNKKELVKKNSKSAYLEAGAHIKSLRTFLNTLSAFGDAAVLNKNMSREEMAGWQKRGYQEGDKTRFEIFQILEKTRYAKKKIYFWMHNWHAMKHSDEIEAFGRDESDASMPSGTISIGTRMAQAYGKKLVTIGNIVMKANCKNPICTPPPVRADSLETKFADFFGKGEAFVDLRKPRPDEQKLPLSTLGSLYADINQGTFVKVSLSRQFDAIYYLYETTPVFEQK